MKDNDIFHLTHLDSNFCNVNQNAIAVLESFSIEVGLGLKTCEFENWIDKECLKLL